METVSVKIKNKWRVLKRDSEIYSQQELEDALYNLNKLDDGSFYFIDYFNLKIVIDSDASLISCGYSKEKVDELGLRFFDLILSPEEKNYLDRVNRAAYRIFFGSLENVRKDLVLSLDLKTKTINGEERILYHKVTPFKLCNNGNMWLSLCKAFLLPARRIYDIAHITNVKTGEKYDFNEKSNEFELRNDKGFSEKEVQILIMMTHGVDETTMGDELNLNLNQVRRLKRKMCEKLGVEKPSELIYKARLERIV